MKIFEGILDQIDAKNVERDKIETGVNHDDFHWRVEVQFPDAYKFPSLFNETIETMSNIFDSIPEIEDYNMDGNHIIVHFKDERLTDYRWFGIDFNIAPGLPIQKIYNRLVFPICQIAVNIRNIAFYFADNKDNDKQVCIPDIDAVMMEGIKTGHLEYFQRSYQSLFYIFRFFSYMSTDYMCSDVFSTNLAPEHCYYDLIFPVIFNNKWKAFWRSLPRENGMRVLSAEQLDFPELQQDLKISIYAYKIEELTVKLQALKLMLDILGIQRTVSPEIIQNSYATRQKLFTNRLFENVEDIKKVIILFPAFKRVLDIYDKNHNATRECVIEMKNVLAGQHDVLC